MGLGIGIGKMAMGGYRKKRPGGGSRNIRRWRGAALMAKAGGHGRRTAGQARRWGVGVIRGSRTRRHAREEWICRPERTEKKEKGREGLTCAAGCSASRPCSPLLPLAALPLLFVSTVEGVRAGALPNITAKI